MKVLVFVDEYDYSHYTFVYNEIRFLRSAGIEILVVCDRIGKLKSTDGSYYRIPMTSNPFLRNLYLWTHRRKLSFFYKGFGYFVKRAQVVNAFKPDIIHIHFGSTAVRLFDVLKETFSRVPCLISFHGFDASSLLKKPDYVNRLKEVLSANVSSAIVSRYLFNNLKSHGLINRNRSYILYYGIDLQEFQRWKRANNKVRTFVQVSNFVEKKDTGSQCWLSRKCWKVLRTRYF